MSKLSIGMVAGACMVPLLAACAAAGTSPPPTGSGSELGQVTGTFEREGGPLGPTGAQPKSVPLSGTVTFTAAHSRPVLVRVGKSGRFAVRLEAGDYRVSGKTPAVRGPGRIASCSVPLTVTVLAGQARHITVVCAVP